MTKRLSLVAALVLACGSLTPAAALTGREVIDTAQKKNGFSTWRDRVLEATMETYTTTLARRIGFRGWLKKSTTTGA